MPGAYTHLKAGLASLELLDDSIGTEILRHKSAYYLGLQGPDLLFYAPGESAVGSHIHEQSFRPLLTSVLERWPETAPEEARADLLAYSLGYISHFALDSGLHPILRNWVDDTFSHMAAETELDRMLLREDGFRPCHYRYEQILPSDGRTAEAAALFHALAAGLDKKTLRQAVSRFHFWRKMARCGSRPRAKFTILFMKFFHYYDKVGSILMLPEGMQGQALDEEKMRRLYDGLAPSVRLSADLQGAFLEALHGGKKLDLRFVGNFS